VYGVWSVSLLALACLNLNSWLMVMKQLRARNEHQTVRAETRHKEAPKPWWLRFGPWLWLSGILVLTATAAMEAVSFLQSLDNLTEPFFFAYRTTSYAPKPFLYLQIVGILIVILNTEVPRTQIRVKPPHDWRSKLANPPSPRDVFAIAVEPREGEGFAALQLAAAAWIEQAVDHTPVSKQEAWSLDPRRPSDPMHMQGTSTTVRDESSGSRESTTLEKKQDPKIPSVTRVSASDSDDVERDFTPMPQLQSEYGTIAQQSLGSN